MLPTINLANVLVCADTRISESCRRHQNFLHEKRMQRNMEGFCIYQAYLRRLRSLHRSYVNKMRQASMNCSSQVQKSQSKKNHQDYRPQQLRYRWRLQQQQDQKRHLVDSGYPGAQCHHLKCAHDEEQRRRAGLLHLRNKFSLKADLSTNQVAPETSSYTARLDAFSKKCQDLSDKIHQQDDDATGKVRHGLEINSLTTSGPEVVATDMVDHIQGSNNKGVNSKKAGDSNNWRNRKSQYGITLKELDPLGDHKNSDLHSELHGLTSARKQLACSITQFTPRRVTHDLNAIHIPCGRDGSFHELDTVGHFRHTHTKIKPAIGATGNSKRNTTVSSSNEALPFGAWRRRFERQRGSVYSDELAGLL